MACLPEVWILTELNVVSVEVAHLGSSEDRHVFELSSADSRAVVSDDEELGLSVSESSQGHLVTWKRECKK